jgi:hypothetical protein
MVTDIQTARHIKERPERITTQIAPGAIWANEKNNICCPFNNVKKYISKIVSAKNNVLPTINNLIKNFISTP